jgi:hypothetical protein
MAAPSPLFDLAAILARVEHDTICARHAAMTPEEREAAWAEEARKIRATPEWREYQLAKGREP